MLQALEIKEMGTYFQKYSHSLNLHELKPNYAIYFRAALVSIVSQSQVIYFNPI